MGGCEQAAGGVPDTGDAHVAGHGPDTAHAPVTPSEHRRALEAVVPAPRVVDVPLRGADLDEVAGAVLAAPVVASVPVPPFTNSAMDGFAVRAADLTGLAGVTGVAAGDRPGRRAAKSSDRNDDAGPALVLDVSADVPAGSAPAPLVPGTAARIMTGAPLPEGADTVVRVEDTDHEAGVAEAPARVTIRRVPPLGANVRERGEDVAPGALVVPAGVAVDAARLAAAISVGARSLRVHPRPRVAVVTTGSELAAPGEELAPGLVPDSNGPMLAALVREAGATVAVRERVPDRPEALVDLVARWEDVDVVVTAGGISQGAFEVVRQAFGPGGAGVERVGARVEFRHVAQQPGGPQGVGSLVVGGRRVPVVCLPGNPVSAFVSFHVYVRGLLDMLAGRRAGSAPVARRARVGDGQGWVSPAGKVQFVPVRIDEAGALERIHHLGSGSHLVASLAGADALAVVPAGVDRVEAGTELEVVDTRPRRQWCAAPDGRRDDNGLPVWPAE